MFKDPLNDTFSFRIASEDGLILNEISMIIPYVTRTVVNSTEMHFIHALSGSYTQRMHSRYIHTCLITHQQQTRYIQNQAVSMPMAIIPNGRSFLMRDRSLKKIKKNFRSIKSNTFAPKIHTVCTIR